MIQILAYGGKDEMQSLRDMLIYLSVQYEELEYTLKIFTTIKDWEEATAKMDQIDLVICDVSDPQAVGMFINIRHQGGYGAVTRVLGKTAKPVNLINVYRALATDSGGQVGTYKTRQAKVYQWLLTYMK